MEYVTGDDIKLDSTDAPKKAKGKSDPAAKAKQWSVELNASKRWMAKFTKTARACESAYLGKFDSDEMRPLGDYVGKVNLFWSNVQVILSAIYGKLPKADVDRKFKDFDDDVARVAGIIMQRILNGDMERDWDDTNAAMRDAVQDRFVSGLGQVWCRYDVETEEYDEPLTDPLTGQPVIDEMGQPKTQKAERIINEEAETDYVYWDDFRYSPCRRWRECRWVARRVYMKPERVAKRFKLKPDQLGMLPIATRMPNDNEYGQQDDVLKATPQKMVAVWEIWSKEENYVCWYCEGCSFLLDEQPDPLELDDFFPCPMPVVATTLTKAFLPRADYAMAQDLYRELDRINARLSALADAVKAAGVYDKTATGVKTLLTTAVQNALVPVDNWSTFVEKGGLKGVTDWLPIDMFVNAITQLSQRKQQLQADLYEVLGISDIMRGASVASETLGAQQLKVQYGGARLANLQNDVARFVSEVMRIRANIVANLFQPETILKRSQIERTPDAQLAQPAVQLLKDFGTSLYSITVTSDSLAAPDWVAEKEARTEFLGATSNYLMAAAPMVQNDPQVGSFLIKLLQWSAAGFKGAQTIEGVLDEAARTLAQKATQPPPPPPPPTPADEKDKASAQKYLAEAAQIQKETALMPNPGAMPGPLPGVSGPGGIAQAGPGPGGPPPAMPLPPQPPMQ
jgi:hypothetical protein